MEKFYKRKANARGRSGTDTLGINYAVCYPWLLRLSFYILGSQ